MTTTTWPVPIASWFDAAPELDPADVLQLAQVPEAICGRRRSQRALRIGYQVQHATAANASSAPSP